jgi:hypothetical protein
VAPSPYLSRRKRQPKIRDTKTVSDVRAETRERERGKRDYPAPPKPKEARLVRKGAVIPGHIAADPKAGQKAVAQGGVLGPNLSRYAAAPLGLLLFGDYDIKRGFNDTKHLAQAGLDVLKSPDASKRDKIEAALGSLAVTGAIGGYGGKAPKPDPTPAEKIIQSLPEAKRLRRQQEAGYRKERAKRAAAAEEAMKAGGEGGYRAALAELKGELPKLKFGALEEFDQKAADQLFTHIQQHPEFRSFEKISTQGALRKVLDGQVPTKSEIRLLNKAFGPEVGTQIAASVTFWRKAKNIGLSVINVPRSVQASIDVSAPFRQGLVLGARHPKMFASEFKPMLKAFKSERAYEDTMAVIAEMPNYPRMQKAKLALTDLQGSAASREDYFNSPIAETLTGGKRFSPIRMSGRAYTAFLNKFRADSFNHYLRVADDAGLDIDDPHLLKSVAAYINTATGRGSIKALEPAMNTLTALFFSPRLIASRLQFFNPGRYAHIGPIGANVHPFAQAQNRKAARNLLGAISLTLALAKMAGAEVGTDSRSADFGKVKVGDTRIDITGGHQGYVVNAARQLRGETVSSTTGEVTELEGGFGKRSAAAVEWDFFKNKAAPVARYVISQQEGQNFAREKFDPLREAYRSLVPIGVGSTADAYKQGGPALAALTGGLGGIGFGVLTYGPEKKKPRKGKSKPRKRTDRSVYVGGGSAGRSPYLTP